MAIRSRAAHVRTIEAGSRVLGGFRRCGRERRGAARACRRRAIFLNPSYHPRSIKESARSVRRVMSPRPASRPATEMSSSSSSQCRPRRLNSTRSRAAAVACSRRGNHASGTPSVRPSVSSTHIVCSSKRTAVGEMLIPCLQDDVPIVGNDRQDTHKLSGIEAIALGDGHLWF